jgi:hypothetical protein
LEVVKGANIEHFDKRTKQLKLKKRATTRDFYKMEREEEF